MLRSRALRWLALVVSAVAGASCADVTGSTSPPSPDSATLMPVARTIVMSFAVLSDEARAKAVRWGPVHNDVEQRVSALIGLAGGTLSLPGADFEMIIPEGAVGEPTMITVTSKKGRHVAFDMQPHGLRFLKPVRAVQGLKNTASYGTEVGNVVRFAYLAEANDQIEEDDSASPVELPAATTLLYGAVAVAETHIWYLNHFSRYILISGVWVCVQECSKK